MIPIALHITNFRSITDRLTFKFPEDAGLYFMSGENGAGKSTIWEALTWLFFGKISRGLKAGDVANWGVGKNTEIVLDYTSLAGEDLSLLRSWKPNRLLLLDAAGEHEITQDQVHEIIGIKFEAWLQAGLIAQFTPKFVDLRPDAKMALFAEVLDLDRWAEYASRASKRASGQDEVSRGLERALERVSGRLEGLDGDDLEGNAETFEKERSQQLLDLERHYDRLIDYAADMKDDLRDAELAEQGYRHALKQITEEAARRSERCPECGQLVTHSEKKLDLSKAEDLLTRAVDKTRRARLASERAEQELDRLEDKHEELKKKTNPYAGLIEKRDRERSALMRERQDLQRQLDDSDSLTAFYDYWVKGFKEIRLQLISEALAEFEIEANSELSALGLPDWSLQFDVDGETKTGKMTRGFTITVSSPANPAPVPWEAWSGGETQRLTLSIQLGFSNLVRSRLGFSMPLEVFDEPTQWINEQGVRDLLDCLSLRAKKEGRPIWIVDHRSLGYGGFKGSVGIVKQKKGSVLAAPV